MTASEANTIFMAVMLIAFCSFWGFGLFMGLAANHYLKGDRSK